jgi:DNA-binding GntR family transcriptional regulator
MGRRSTPSLVTIASAVYGQLREDILRGTLAPGLKLRIEWACEHYGAGSSPVREALSRLSAEGLVERREQRGFLVAPISPDDLLDLVRTRCWVETLALRQSIEDASSAWHESIVLALHRLSRVPCSTKDDGYYANPDWERLHGEFHHALVSNCGSGRLLHFCDDLADQAYRYRQLSFRLSYPYRDIHDEHQRLAEAVLRSDADGAVSLLAEHYERTAEVVRDELCMAPADRAA